MWTFDTVLTLLFLKLYTEATQLYLPLTVYGLCPVNPTEIRYLVCVCESCDTDHYLKLEDLDAIGPSASEVGSSSRCEPRSSISIYSEE